MKIKGKQTWQFKNDIYLSSTGTSAGPREKEGPLSSYFDKTYSDLYCGEKNWERAERRLMEDAVTICLEKADKPVSQVDLFLAGDLLNQIVTSNFFAGKNQIPYLGMFGACSTSMETLAVGAALVDGGFADVALAACSSHNATAERQFRYPTEYGGQKPDTTTSTATGAGAALISREPSPIKITEATIGKVFDWGIKDPFNMGAAMAPAAADTIAAHLTQTGRSVSDYDLIVTGDLSSVGTPIVKEMLYEKGFDVSSVHQDCGLMLYRPGQKVFAGGSGCASSALVTYGYIVDELIRGNLRRVLIVATGALHSPVMVQQKEAIPGIAHGVVLEAAGGNQS
ncbi:MAG TPA: stage V sporulation protein AD [Bacillales bacterium]|nr:stage V sporulation protein AD [Bacillales bacterium]